MGKAGQPQKRLCCQLPARQQQAANAKSCRGDQSATVNLECHNWNFPLPRAQGVTTLHTPLTRRALPSIPPSIWRGMMRMLSCICTRLRGKP